MLCTTPGLATVALSAILAFGPFGGCGASHRGSRDTINPGTPNTPTETPTPPPEPTPETPSGGVPEPASLLLAAGAAVGYGVFRNKRKKHGAQTPDGANPQA